jgi:hypothetical protein
VIVEEDELGIEKIFLRKAEDSDGSICLLEVGSETPRKWRLQKSVEKVNLQNVRACIGSAYRSAPFHSEQMLAVNTEDRGAVINEPSMRITGSTQNANGERETFGVEKHNLRDDGALVAEKIPWEFTFWLNSQQVPEGGDEDDYLYPVAFVDARLDLATVISSENAIKLSFDLPERELVRIIESLSTLGANSLQLEIRYDLWVRDTGGSGHRRGIPPEDLIWGLGKAFLVGWEVEKDLAQGYPEAIGTLKSADDAHRSNPEEPKGFPKIPNDLLEEVEEKVDKARAQGIRIRTRVLAGTIGVFASVVLAMFLVEAPPSAYIVGSVIVGTLALVYTALTVSASANTQSDTLDAILLFYGEQLRGEGQTGSDAGARE